MAGPPAVVAGLVTPYPYFWTRNADGSLTGHQMGEPWNVRSIYRQGERINMRNSTSGPEVTLATFDDEGDAEYWLRDLTLRLLTDALQR